MLLFRFGIEETDSEQKSTKTLLIATFSHMTKIKQIFIIPLTIWSGLEQGFLQADFTAVSILHAVLMILSF